MRGRFAPTVVALGLVWSGPVAAQNTVERFAIKGAQNIIMACIEALHHCR